MSPAESLALALRLIAHPFTSTAELTEADRATLAEAANTVTRLAAELMEARSVADQLAAAAAMVEAHGLAGATLTEALARWRDTRVL